MANWKFGAAVATAIVLVVLLGIVGFRNEGPTSKWAAGSAPQTPEPAPAPVVAPRTGEKVEKPASPPAEQPAASPAPPATPEPVAETPVPETPTPEPPTPAPLPKTCNQSPLGPNEMVASCPMDSEVVKLYAQRRRQRLGTGAAEKWMLVDVGANKGYSISSTLQAIGVEGIDDTVVVKAAFKEFARIKPGAVPNTNMMCGACCDCAWRVAKDSPDVPWSVKIDSLENDEKAKAVPALDVDYYAFDGQPSNFEHLTRLFGPWKPTKDDQKVRVNLTKAGVSATAAESVTFSDTQFGDEIGAIGRTHHEAYGRLKTVKVRQTSLNAFMPENVDYIDVLLTDTEGHDFFVLDGMSRFIRPPMDGEPARNKVGIYVFETWGKDRPLKNVIQYVEQSGYTCYFPIKHARPHKQPPLNRWMVKVSGPCWQDRYNQDGWGWKNVICLNNANEDLRWVGEQLENLPRPVQSCRYKREDREKISTASWAWIDNVFANYNY